MIGQHDVPIACDRMRTCLQNEGRVLHLRPTGPLCAIHTDQLAHVGNLQPADFLQNLFGRRPTVGIGGLCGCGGDRQQGEQKCNPGHVLVTSLRGRPQPFCDPPTVDGV